uniref:Uncharacterized protein n=1 Tax=Anopheles atroparvus TaxID=41427 RepID=A0AAG5CY49_ANOAO
MWRSIERYLNLLFYFSLEGSSSGPIDGQTMAHWRFVCVYLFPTPFRRPNVYPSVPGRQWFWHAIEDNRRSRRNPIPMHLRRLDRNVVAVVAMAGGKGTGWLKIAGVLRKTPKGYL